MISPNRQPGQVCSLGKYTIAWEMGTGLRISLAPGDYKITGEEDLNGVRYFQLDETYRIAAELANRG